MKSEDMSKYLTGSVDVVKSHTMSSTVSIKYVHACKLITVSVWP